MPSQARPRWFPCGDKSTMGTTIPSTKNVCVATDLEPDDMLALAVLKARGFHIRYGIVGEGDPEAKSPRFAAYTEALGFPVRDSDILEGCPSDKQFPGEQVPAYPGPKPKHTFTFFESMVDAGVTHVMYLKPPRELMVMWTTNRPRAQALFSRIHLAIYGSFNLRTIGYVATAWITDPDTPFASVRLYQNVNGCLDRDGAPVKNLNPITCPEFFARYSPTSQLAQVMSTWDKDVVDDCHKTCRELGDPEQLKDAAAKARWHRNAECAAQVSAYFGRQFVAADPVLACAVWDPVIEATASVCVPVVITHPEDKPYPVVTDLEPDNPCRVKLYRGLPLSMVTGCLAGTPWF